MEIIEKKAISNSEMQDNINEMKKRDKELNFRAKKVEDYLNHIPKTKTYKDLKHNLETAEITRLRDNHISSIINILPTDMDSLKNILSSENLTLKQVDLEKILDIVKKYA
jgi:DNA-directed RNA polymerase subunit F